MRRASAVPVLAMALALPIACSQRAEEYEERGDRFSATGDYVDAQAEYRLAIDEAGGEASADLRFKSGELALRFKDFSEAGRVFGGLLAAQPDRRDEVGALYHLHARKWIATGDTFAALEAIDWLLERDSVPRLGSLWFTLGDARYRRPDYDGAITAYLTGLATTDEVPPVVYARLGDAYERRRNCDAALDYFSRYLEEEAADSLDIGQVQYRMGKCAFRLAERAFDNGQWGTARRYVALMMRVGEPAGQLDDARLILARIHERLGEREAAIAMYERIDRGDEDEQRSRAALEAHRRLVQLDFGMPLRTAERVAAERAGGRRDGSEIPDAERP